MSRPHHYISVSQRKEHAEDLVPYMYQVLQRIESCISGLVRLVYSQAKLF